MNEGWPRGLFGRRDQGRPSIVWNSEEQGFQSTAISVTKERLKAVRAARKSWVGQLQDLGPRNNLLFFREQKAGTLDLSQLSEAEIQALFDGKAVHILGLFEHDEVRQDVLRRLRRIYAKARQFSEEQGVGTMFLAIGFASWESERTPVRPNAPVLLQPAILKPTGAAQTEFTLRLTGDMELSSTLLHIVETEFGQRLDLDALGFRIDGAIDTAPEVQTALDWLRGAAAHVPAFAIQPGLTLANFNYAKLPMVKDLEVAGDWLAQNEIAAALAGDEKAIAGLRDRNRAVTVDVREPDRVAPGREMLVLDADSSQSYVIDAVLAGRNLIVKGPPGTGKSQTIANLIAAAIGSGKTVLFVAQKRAAIEAVTKRLRASGLADLLLDLHGVDTRREVAEMLARAIDLIGRTPEPLPDASAADLAAARDRLSGHVSATHDPRDPWGVSVYQARIRCYETLEAARTDQRLDKATLARLDAAAYRTARTEMQALADLDPFGRATVESPWHRLQDLSPDAAQLAFENVSQIRASTLDRTLAGLEELAGSIGLEPRPTLGAWRALMDALAEIEQAVMLFGPGVFGPEAGVVAGLQVGPDDLPHLDTARRSGGRQQQLIASWEASFRSLFNRPAATAGAEVLAAYDPTLRGAGRLRARLLDSAYKEARAWIRPLLLTPWTSDEEAAAVLARAIHASRYWSTTGASGSPRVPASPYSRVQAAFATLLRQLTEIRPVLDHPADTGPGEPVPFEALDLETLRADLDRLTNERGILLKVPRIDAHVAALASRGLTSVLERMAGDGLPADQLVARLDYVWHRSILDQVEASDGRLATFDPLLQTAAIGNFCRLDHAELARYPLLIKRAFAARAVEAMDRWPEQGYLIRHQASLKRGHMPLRRLFAQAPEMMLAIKPAWVMSPLLVSQWLPLDHNGFDIVVFDEASQVQPADAIPAIVRGRQLVVAGDDRQLPPTTFFASQPLTDEADEDSLMDELAAASGFESVLDAVAPILETTMLSWHYRSRDESLIAFSNRHFYDGNLTTFPSSTGRSCLRHIIVDGAEAGAPRGQRARKTSELSAPAEVDRVVKLVLESAQERPHESLGVIALGIEHAEAISDALHAALKGRDTLDPFFDEAAPEPFFVKNLERVQGDERDAIILSIGYGKSADGRMLYRFGPLNIEGGERRLNVAVTRARSRMTVVSSFAASEMDGKRTRSRGAQLLRDYLAYVDGAEADGKRTADSGSSTGLTELEQDIVRTLAADGIRVVPRLGSSGQIIDFAALHPSNDGRYVMAIELDGPGYAAIPTTRDRDRLRTEQLARLGWGFHRLWTQWWLTDKTAAAAVVKQAFEQSVRAADHHTGSDTGASKPTPSEPSAQTSAPEPPATAESATGSLADATSAPADRGPCPITRKQRVRSYKAEELVALVDWIEADAIDRSELQVEREVLRALGLKHTVDENILYQAIFVSRKRRWKGPYKAYPKPLNRNAYNLVHWIESDGLLRSEDQLFEEYLRELGRAVPSRLGDGDNHERRLVREARRRLRLQKP